MRLPYFIALVGLVSALPVFADEQKIIRLEQDVRELERIVADHGRQIDELRRESGRPSMTPSARPRSASSPTAEPAQWLNIKNWERVRVGQGELEVIEALGVPSSMRTAAGDTRILLYAMELGASGFLGGSVTMRGRKVVEVERPVLK